MFGSCLVMQCLGQIKKISVFWITSLKILGKVDTYYFYYYLGAHIFFLSKNIILCILKGILSFKMHKKNFKNQKTWKKNLGFTSKFR